MTGHPSLWTFAIAFYGKPGVSDSLIALQDRLGADVDRLLFALWAGQAFGHELDGSDRRKAAELVEGWQSEVVAPLRAARRAILARSPLASRQCERIDALREELLEVEIRLEHVELDALEGLPAAWGEASSTGPAERHACAMRNLRSLLADLDVEPDGKSEAAVGVISAALRRFP